MLSMAWISFKLYEIGGNSYETGKLEDSEFKKNQESC